MNRTLVGLMAAVMLAGCGMGNVSSLASDVEAPTERPAASEEAALRTASTYDAVFENAGREFNVPAVLLKSLSWSLTRYESIASDGEFEGAVPVFGVMALSPAHVTEAALEGVTESAVRADVASNVRVAAAWLSREATVQGIDRSKLLAWGPVVGAYTKLDDLAGRQAFVRGEVYAALKLGVGRLSDELDVTMVEELEPAVGDYSEVLQGLDRAPDYGAGVWRPSPNFNSRSGQNPKFVVIHTCEGSYSSCWSWLTNTAASASAHYVVNTTGTEVSQLVRESDRAWHISATYDCAKNGNTLCSLNGASSNTHSVGIEHAGFASQTGFPTAQIDASAKLACSITKKWSIPRDRFHLVGHGQLQPATRTDPGANWPWTTYLNKVNAECGTGGGGGGTSQLIIDSNNANNDQTRGYIQLSANWKSSANVPGYYGSGYWYAPTAAVSDGAAFFFKLDSAQTRTIDGWWTAGSDRSTAVSFVAFNAAGERVGEGVVNQTANGGKWNTVGTFNFSAGWNKIVVSRWQATGKVVIADAVRVR